SSAHQEHARCSQLFLPRHTDLGQGEMAAIAALLSCTERGALGCSGIHHDTCLELKNSTYTAACVHLLSFSIAPKCAGSHISRLATALFSTSPGARTMHRGCGSGVATNHTRRNDCEERMTIQL